jgi:hypothetical protein
LATTCHTGGVLAGAGGVGKTSVAYEFTEQLIRYPEQPFDQILWLSAKQRQFDALQNTYRRVSETHYHTFDELLSALCFPFAHDREDILAKSQNERRRFLRDGFSIIPSFVIIDDMDSLKTDEQKKVGEFVAWLSGNNSRFLITTRHNHTFSSSTSIHVDGFERDEFEDFLRVLAEHLPQVNSLTRIQRRKLFSTTQGSPLLSESVVRNLRYSPFDQALASWRGENGELARAAVLRREISQLSLEALRVLVAASMLRSASIAELASVTGYPKTIVEAAVDELDRLFLVARPPIAKEPRFAVNETTARLVLDSAEELVADHRKLQKAVEELSQEGSPKKKINDSIVGNAIRQAFAFVREDKVAEALRTLDAVHTRKKHPDILSFKAKILFEATPPRVDQARLIAREAYRAGGRKPHLFELWFQSEWEMKQFSGAVDASEAALKHEIPSSQEWNVRLSAALIARAEDRETADVEGARKDLAAASGAMATAIKTSGLSERQQWLGKLFEIHDRLIALNRKSNPSLSSMSLALDEIIMMNRNGDTRRCLAWVALNLMEYIRRKGKSFQGKEHQVLRLMDRIDQILDLRRESSGAGDERDAALFMEWNKVRSRLLVVDVPVGS